ncbi:16S rRNA (guanine(966)-N(2))-methyltransferase RsmD [Microaerobacter geothermalis]|uniref:16S rRNA (guanine(966)-N(2))-methyltransferase RsmD n=1 Tax=Microaerobacter geothermalis TaxID=674972 RepID=UPI001F1B5FFE|nr:16S rRNA (guanine(966)-N(2))-methyltransferase RsmD [Microaerobacter geothermalis]MCF6095045.1 16S rRNA (guanine(966)-N(2))-methyltransferase RsmD [Microaerobacter geothermalis]
MRIIAGRRKGHPLISVPGRGTRPTTDKVKESIFNMVGPYFNGGRGLDLFAGTGSLGLEGISRGMDKVIFVDQDKKAIQTIWSNVKELGFESKVEVYRNDAERALKILIKRGMKFDYVFLDPPYDDQKISAMMGVMDDHGLLNTGAVVIAEHDHQVFLPEKNGGLLKEKESNYGTTSISIYKKST